MDEGTASRFHAARLSGALVLALTVSPAAADVELRERLMAHVEMLGRTIGERNAWKPAALERAARYIEDALHASGYAPTREAFEVPRAALGSGPFGLPPGPVAGLPETMHVANVIAERPGREADAGLVVVGAHYDSVIGSNGANDNGTGVAALLEMARAFQQETFLSAVRFVAFVNEEPPFFQTAFMGSRVHARGAKARRERIAAMISLETIGFYSDVKGSQRHPFPLGFFYPHEGNFLAFISDLGAASLMKRALEAFRATGLLPAEGLSAPALVPGVDWSDHASFRAEGYPAIMVTDTAPYRYPHYHLRSDTPDKIEPERFARAVAGLIRTVAILADNP